jgi:imidazolonepropionase-like amidohydrolase
MITRAAAAAVCAVLFAFPPMISPVLSGRTGHGQSSNAVTAIVSTTVLPMTGGAPALNTTVIIRDGRIASMGPSDAVEVPANARAIDGRGKYLMPGLVEMHSHLSKARASALGLFVANGVTTLREVGGDHQELLQWRREVRAGTRVGPDFLIAGPYLESARNIERMRKDPPSERVEPFDRIRIPVATPADARRVVASLAAQELDFLKVRTTQDAETYAALVQAAHAHGLRLVGHVTGLSPKTVLDAGQDGIEHAFLPETVPASRDERMTIWRAFAAKGVVIVPTLVTATSAVFTPIDRLRAMVDDDEGRVEPRRRYVSLFLVKDWKEQLLEVSAERQTAYRGAWESILRNLREMHEAGMDVLAGSDVAVLNVFPGSTLHEELALFVKELGMTTAEALDRATRRSAKWLGLGDSIGTVERGKVANLVLLDANPLDDIANTRRIAAVVLRGVVHDKAGIETLLAAVEAAPDRRTDDWGRK